ncbi:hypothetical protein [Magnetospirillum molischianum]|uniref:hypothetical protein n=1 Tax=Magnetospirillum molischianum TaxID=1083 RepID=UPI0002DC37C7|nr:hypothetical protein [Magnetospirillum molischianum]
MSRSLIPTILATLIVTTLPNLAAGQGGTLTIDQPVSYGRLELGDSPPPRLIYSRPKSIGPITMDRAPIYLHVPSGHARNWRKNCRRYDACGERVYFVQENWYNQNYVRRSRDGHRDPPHERRDSHEQEPRGPMGNDHPGNGRDR